MKVVVKTVVLFMLLTTHNLVFGQDGVCGTELSEESRLFLENAIDNDKNKFSARTNSIDVLVPVKFFIIRRSDGTGGLSPSRISALLAEVNNLYQNAGIEFFEPEPFELVDNDLFFSLDQSEETDLAVSRDLPGAINIYISNTLTDGDVALCGYTRFPPSVDRVFLASGCADNEVGTTAHELGHYFTLFHTHGKTNFGTTDELVERVDCETLGDNICDTPADPNLSGLVSSCQYVGNVTDRNGVPFEPDPNNIMSYAPNSCRDLFSQGQYDRIRAGLENGRTNLNVIFQNFAARFSSDTRAGCSPLVVEFEDITSGVASREWFFEGGDISTSVSPRPTVTYTTPGRYDVELVATNSSGGTSQLLRQDFITVQDKFRNISDEFQELFEVPSLPEKWSISNLDQLETFTISSISRDVGSNSLFIDNLNYIPETSPQIDEVELPNVALQEVKAISINFSYAYTYRAELVDELESIIGSDSLEIGYRLDCEDEFFSLSKSGGADLATINPTSILFEPQSDDDWSSLSINVFKPDLNTLLFDELEVFRPVIRSISGNGNSLYIDEVSIELDYSLDSVEFFRISDQSEENVVLRWSNPAINEAGVIIERSVDGINFVAVDSVMRNESTYEDVALPEGWSTLYYRVLNYNSKEQSNVSEVAVATNTVTSIGESVPELNDDLVFKIFPNPSNSGMFYLEIDCFDVRELSELNVYNSQGSLVKSLEKHKGIKYLAETNLLELDLSNLRSGVYIIHVNNYEDCSNQSAKLFIY